MTSGWGDALFAGVLGLIFGSFLNVCIHRLPRHLSVIRPASRCGACGRTLTWYENIPVISYLVLRARCRTCGERISVLYPLVELATAAVFMGGYFAFGPGLLLVSRLLFACAMLVLLVVDLQHRILPNAITVPGVVVGFVFSLFTPPGWMASLIGVASGGGVLLGIAEAYYRIRGEEGLGMGDVKMLAMIGAFLGWKLMLVTLFLSSFLGSAVGLAMIAMRRGSLKYALPFGSFLAIGALVASVAGDGLLEWYLSYY